MNPTQRRSGRDVAIALAASLLGHGALVAALATAPPPPPPEKAHEPVEFEVVHTEPPPPEPEPEPEPEPPPRIAPRPPPKPTPVAEAPPREAPPPPPPPSTPPPPEQPPAPIRIGVSLSSTTEGGSFAVGTGSSLHGRTPDRAAAPSEATHEAQEAAQAPYVPYSQLSTLPRPISVPHPTYPAKMRQLQIEGRVILECRIDEHGRPSRIRVIQSLGKEFDELAIASMRKARFEPGTRKGEPVTTDIRYTFVFELE
ncbi:MAG TPA: TonB family protein [Vulgatibacter sp.]|nr:TonB family protein [Vulgatibacter sp.]